MTMLKHYAACPRSGYLYARDKGAAQTVQMVRGAAAHEIFERGTQLMVAQDEPRVPAELLKVIVAEVLAEKRVPWSEHDYVREISYRWAEEWTVDPRRVIACETLMVLELGGWQLRGKVDYAEAREGGVVYVADYKTARAAPAYEDIARKRSDGRWAAKAFQLVCYALLLAYGQPVRVVELTCDSCDGNGYWGGDPGEDKPCTNCKGRGVVREEILEPFPLAGNAERFDLELVFPGIETADGNMVRRGTSVTRLELAEYRESMLGLLSALADDEASGEWPAIVSDEACSECPCAPECPIPVALRDHRGEINSVEQAAEAASVLHRKADEAKALRAELRAWTKAHGGELRFGRNMVMRFKLQESDRIADKEGMFEAIDRAADYGERFERTAYVQRVSSSNFVTEKLSEDELEVEAAA